MAKWRFFHSGFACAFSRCHVIPGGGSKWNLHWRNSGSGGSWGVDVCSNPKLEATSYSAVWMVFGWSWKWWKNDRNPERIKHGIWKSAWFCSQKESFLQGVLVLQLPMFISACLFLGVVGNGFKHSKDLFFSQFQLPLTTTRWREPPKISGFNMVFLIQGAYGPVIGSTLVFGGVYIHIDVFQLKKCNTFAFW